MKSKRRKIRLQRETLTRLGQAGFDQVAEDGLMAVRAAASEPLSSGPSWCGGSCMTKDCTQA